MKTYKPPSLVSYKSHDILEIIGPAQSAYVPLDVGGGWDEKVSLQPVMICERADISPETGIKIIDETIV